MADGRMSFLFQRSCEIKDLQADVTGGAEEFTIGGMDLAVVDVLQGKHRGLVISLFAGTFILSQWWSYELLQTLNQGLSSQLLRTYQP